jgi:DNA polymerase III epsilon subunit-like protein
MDTAIIFDCEFLVVEGTPQNFWCGPFDPDPVIAQIGAAKLSLRDAFPILDTTRLYVKPVDRHRRAYAIDPFFTKLTGITEQAIATEGISLQEAIDALDRFSDGAQFWSWGKDELNMMAISCYVAGIEPSIPAHRFDNACKLLLRAGMPYEDMKRTRSNRLADYYRIEHPPLKGHDALDDALSVTYVLQYLLKAGQLLAEHFSVGRITEA